MTGLVDVARHAAHAAGEILLEGLQKPIEISYKGVRNLVTNIDRMAEAQIVETIRHHFPTHEIEAEEGSQHRTGSPYRWIIDPLDGTTNYSHRFPFFCISIGLIFEGKPHLGVVYDPMRQEFFLAEAGRGATLNGKALRVSTVAHLSESLLSTGFAYDLETRPENNLNRFVRMSLVAQAIRRTGSAALDLCYVAAGRFDGFWEQHLHPWDTAAGVLMVAQAGGCVTRFSGGDYSINDPDVLATNGHIHAQIVQHLSREDSHA